MASHTYFEVKAGNDGQLLHGQLLGRLLVTMTTAALDLRAAAEMFWSGKPGRESRGRVGGACFFLLKCLWEPFAVSDPSSGRSDFKVLHTIIQVVQVSHYFFLDHFLYFVVCLIVVVSWYK